MKIFYPLLSASFLLFGCAEYTAQLKIEQAFPNFTFQQPVDIQNSGDGTNRLFILEQAGKIWVFENGPGTSEKKLFLDLTDKVSSGGEMGLLGLAFHPNYKSNGYFYLDYTVNNPRQTIISRFKASTDINRADKGSETVLMRIDQPYSNHNGGQLSFGPDGFLYISLGDGGSGGDPQNHAQNLSSFLGKILRIDVDHTSEGLNYSIPADNPFKVNSPDFKGEIYAYGLRNVWRFSFDPVTKILWGADVGQNSWEEIDLIEKGGNYGWRCYEGNHSYNTSDCGSKNFIKPIWEFAHDNDGGYSITGGFVYRGRDAGELTGKYIYGDFVSGNIWSLDYSGGIAKNRLLFKGAHNVSTFGVDENRELYFANYNNGRIYKFRGTASTGGRR